MVVRYLVLIGDMLTPVHRFEVFNEHSSRVTRYNSFSLRIYLGGYCQICPQVVVLHGWEYHGLDVFNKIFCYDETGGQMRLKNAFTENISFDMS